MAYNASGHRAQGLWSATWNRASGEQKGYTPGAALEETGYFPAMAISLIQVGQETGQVQCHVSTIPW